AGVTSCDGYGSAAAVRVDFYGSHRHPDCAVPGVAAMHLAERGGGCVPAVCAADISSLLPFYCSIYVDYLHRRFILRRYPCRPAGEAALDHAAADSAHVPGNRTDAEYREIRVQMVGLGEDREESRR